MIETYFLTFLEEIDDISYRHKYRAFTHLLEVAKESGLIKKHFVALLGIFPLLPYINRLPEHNQIDACSKLIEAIKGTELGEDSVFKEWKELNSDFNKVF